MSAQRIVLAERPPGLVVLVDLVRGHADDRNLAALPPDRLEQVDGAHDVRLERLAWHPVALTHDRLGGEVEDEVRLRRRKRRLERGGVADVADSVRHDPPRKSQLRKERRPRRRRQRKAVNLGTGRKQQLAEPASLEPGMPGHEHALSSIDVKHMRIIPKTAAVLV